MEGNFDSFCAKNTLKFFLTVMVISRMVFNIANLNRNTVSINKLVS